MIRSVPKKSALSNEALLREAIENSRTIGEVLVYVGLSPTGGNYGLARKWADQFGLTLPRSKPTPPTQVAKPDEEVFRKDSSYNRSHLRKRLRRIWRDWSCASCGIGEEWMGKPLTLQIEHKNGVNNDHRLENLELLCPNCHSQTDTFAGRNIGSGAGVVL